MKIVLILSAIYITLGAVDSKPWIFEDKLREYLDCMSEYSSASVVETSNDTFSIEERTIPKYKRSSFSDEKIETIFSNITDNNSNGKQPITVQTKLMTGFTALDQAVTGHSVGVDASFGGKVGKIGISASVTFEEGGSQNFSTTQKNVTEQSWIRNFEIPPFMKETSTLVKYKRTITTPEVNEEHAKGYIPIRFDNFEESRYEELWEKCGKTEPRIVVGSNPAVLLVKISNLVPEDSGWEMNSDGSISKFFKEVGKITETRDVIRYEVHTDFLDKKVEMSKYCGLIDPDKTLDPIIQTKKEKGDLVNKVTGTNSILNVNLNGEFGDDDDDDDDDDNKSNNQNKRKDPKKHKKH